MENRLALAGVLVVSAAIVTSEVAGESKAHADYAVPAVPAANFTNTTNVAMSANTSTYDLEIGPGAPNPLDYLTKLATGVIIEVKR
jgi:hypothetical protein